MLWQRSSAPRPPARNSRSLIDTADRMAGGVRCASGRCRPGRLSRSASGRNCGRACEPRHRERSLLEWLDDQGCRPALHLGNRPWLVLATVDGSVGIRRGDHEGACAKAGQHVASNAFRCEQVFSLVGSPGGASWVRLGLSHRTGRGPPVGAARAHPLRAPSALHASTPIAFMALTASPAVSCSATTAQVNQRCLPVLSSQPIQIAAHCSVGSIDEPALLHRVLGRRVHVDTLDRAPQRAGTGSVNHSLLFRSVVTT